MSEQSKILRIKLRIHWGLMRIFQIFIIICLVDGFLDIVYPAASFTKNYLIRKIHNTSTQGSIAPDPMQEIVMPESGFTVRQEPGIRGIANEYHSVDINIEADGLRQNGQTHSENRDSVGLLLGSSVAFGYGVADNQTLAAHLERALDNVRIYNYAGLAQPTPDNTLRWYDLQKKHGNPDFVILAAANYQIYSDCQPPSGANTKSNIFLFLFDRVSDKFLSKKISPCASSKNLDLAIKNSILSIENAIEFGRKQGIPFYVVYLPTPYDANVNIDNLLKSQDAKEHIFAMRHVYSRYQQELANLNMPEFINLSHALPSETAYFFDEGGHLSGEGNRLIAEALLQKIRTTPGVK